MTVPKFKIFRIEVYKPGKSNIGEIKNITKSLLVSLIPLHNEPTKFKKYINLAKK